MKKLVFLTFVIVVVARYLGRYWFYEQVWEYDSLVHFLGGIFAGSLGIWVAHFIGKKNYFSFAVSYSFIIGLLWELHQCYYPNYAFPILDSTIDMIMDVLGGVVIGIIVTIWAKKQK